MNDIDTIYIIQRDQIHTAYSHMYIRFTTLLFIYIYFIFILYMYMYNNGDDALSENGFTRATSHGVHKLSIQRGESKGFSIPLVSAHMCAGYAALCLPPFDIVAHSYANFRTDFSNDLVSYLLTLFHSHSFSFYYSGPPVETIAPYGHVKMSNRTIRKCDKTL